MKLDDIIRIEFSDGSFYLYTVSKKKFFDKELYYLKSHQDEENMWDAPMFNIEQIENRLKKQNKRGDFVKYEIL